MSDGKYYNEITRKFVPRTEADVEKLARLGQLTKQQLHKNIIKFVQESLSDFPYDQYLLESLNMLKIKTYDKFNPKSLLVDLCNEIEEYVENLMIDNQIEELCDSD